MKKTLLFLFAASFLYLVSCGANPDFTEIGRSMDDITRRIDRMKTIADGMKGKDIESYKKTFLWNIEEFETMMTRLTQELDDIKKSEKDGLYSGAQIVDFRDIIDRLRTDADKLSNTAEDAVKFMNMSGIKAMETEAANFLSELKKYRSELGKISQLVSQLKSDSPLKKADEMIDNRKPGTVDSVKTQKDTATSVKSPGQAAPDTTGKNKP